MTPLFQDLRQSLRGLSRHPGFTTVAVVVFALGIGAATAVHGLAGSLLWRRLAVRDPSSLVAVLHNTDKVLHQSHPYLDFEHYRDHSLTLGSVAAATATEVVVEIGDELATATCYFVSDEYFGVLGISPSVGVLPLRSEVASSGIPVLLSDTFWRRHLPSGRDALGHPLHINGRLATITGVAPRTFNGTEISEPPDLWVPVSTYASIQGMTPDDAATLFTQRTNESFQIIGRLGPGATVQQAEMDARRLHAQLESVARRASTDATIVLLPLEEAQLLPSERAPVVALLLVLTTAAGLLLLTACINGGGLMLLRFLGRSRELAIRVALGAGRADLLRRLLLEAMATTLLGGAGGIALSRSLMGWLGQVATVIDPAIRVDAHLDWRTAGFALGLTVTLGLLVGLLPALRASRVDPMGALKGIDTLVQMRPRGYRLNEVFLVAQIAVSLALVVNALLLLLSLHKALSLDLGFESRDQEIVQLRADAGMPLGLAPDSAGPFMDVLERIRSLPGVEAAALSATVPLGGRRFMRQVQVNQGDMPESMTYNAVTGDYLKALGVPILRGRGIEPGDSTGARLVAVVNETFAARHWPGVDPLGRTFQVLRRGQPPLEYEVVGLARNGKYEQLGEAPRSFYYVSLDQHGAARTMNLIVRPRSRSGRLLPAIRDEIRGSGQPVAIANATTLSAHVNAKLIRQRLGAGLTVGASAVAVLVAVIGIASTTAYSVARRRKEIAIRLAVGGTPGGIFRMMLGGGLRVVGLGLVGGYALGILTSRGLESLLFGVRALDPAVLLLAGVIVAAAGVTAVVLPAWEAAAMDPTAALRAE
jgi:predicted permease